MFEFFRKFVLVLKNVKNLNIFHKIIFPEFYSIFRKYWKRRKQIIKEKFIKLKILKTFCFTKEKIKLKIILRKFLRNKVFVNYEISLK